MSSSSDLISSMSSSNAEFVLSQIRFDPNKIGLLHSYITKLITVCEITQFVAPILSTLKNEQNSSSVLFHLLSCLPSKKDDGSRLIIIDALKHTDFTVASLIDLLQKNEMEHVILDVLNIRPEFHDSFIREALNVESIVASKNISLVFPLLNIKYFINYKSFTFMFEREHHYIRNCLIDIIENLIIYFKGQSNIESIKELTLLLYERLQDCNFYVRSKVLGTFGNLFKSEAILKDQRNLIISGIIERSNDKTVIVRKRSINLLSQVLINHPFKNKSTMERNNSQDLATSLGHDYNEFVSLMENALLSVTALLDCNFKTDIIEISTFIKWAYLLKVNGSKQALFKILGVVFTKEKNVIIDLFKEVLTRRGEILYEFINDKAFEVILRCLDVDEKALFKNIYNGERVFESIYILKQINKVITEDKAISLINHISSILFTSNNESELNINVGIYINTLSIIKNIRYRIEADHEIFTLVIKNICKMVFFERSLIKATVGLIYSISINPEITCSRMVRKVSQSKSTLKILDMVGWVCLNQYYLLEKLEKKIKGLKIALDPSIREKRLSLEESRTSIKQDIKSTEDSRQGFRLSLKLGEFEESLKTKSEEEVADFLFYLKENEVLYSETSILHQFIPLLKVSINSNNVEVQITAYSSLFKCMLTSSLFFKENIHFIDKALEHSSSPIRNLVIIALHDFIIFYNSYFNSSILFNKLEDQEVSRNAILVIFALLQKNVIRIKNNSVKIISFLFDELLGPIVKTIIKTLSGSNNIMSIVFLETFFSDLPVEYVKYLSSFVSTSIQESLFIKCLKTPSKERLKVMFENFDLSEKFIKDNMFREEVKALVETSTMGES